MRTDLPAVFFTAILILVPVASSSFISPESDRAAGVMKEKDHDFLPRFHNVIFLFDVSDSMTAGYPQNFDHSRLFVAARAFALFNWVMPHVPRWQYNINSALITYGDCDVPKIRSLLSPWSRGKFGQYYNCMRIEGFGPKRTAALQDALQVAGSLMSTAAGRTAIVIFSDGGNQGECPQKTAAALKDAYGDKVEIFAVYFGTYEVSWRNLYEVCKLTGGYARTWEEVRTKAQMKDFAWDITVREIMFPYPEIFFQVNSADLLPSEALKLESVANFLHAVPQYVLQIDGHTTFLKNIPELYQSRQRSRDDIGRAVSAIDGNTRANYRLAMTRAQNVRNALISIYKIHPARIQIRSWGEELPRYDNQNPEMRPRNDQANVYLMLPLRNFPYDEKYLHTFGVNAVGNIFNTQEREKDTEWAWPAKPAVDAALPVMKNGR
jgi:outer membrane protein OmpA-like peptidoglycan-associated protein